jgi:hypothetical protein
MGNLTNLLALAVGFVTVMLLLSLVVTGLVQTVSSMLGLRWRSDRGSLLRFLVQECGVDLKRALEIADEIFKLPVAKGALRVRAEAWWIRIWGSATPREVGWTEIKPVLDKEPGMKWDPPHYERLRARMSDDYAAKTRFLSFLLAFAVAFGFQVSAPKLMRDLSTSDELRASALAASKELSKSGAAIEPSGAPFRRRAIEALEELAKKHPAAAGALEQMSGVSDTREEVVAELGAILGEGPEAAALVTAYQDLLDRQQKGQATTARALGDTAAVSLAALDIGFAENLCFYRTSPKCPGSAPDTPFELLFANLAGVLMTGVLLTFGAPFWYDKLKELNVLQNQLRKLAGKDGPEGEAKAAEPPKPAEHPKEDDGKKSGERPLGTAV